MTDLSGLLVTKLPFCYASIKKVCFAFCLINTCGPFNAVVVSDLTELISTSTITTIQGITIYYASFNHSNKTERTVVMEM